MYSASSAFHNAVANGAHQIAMLIFDDCVFTNDDINVSKGIEFNDYFNTEEDLSIGQALSNEIVFSLFNDERLLNDYEFGEFLATIGALISETTFVTHSSIYVQSESNTYTAHQQKPYLKRNGVALSVQPNYQVNSILIYKGKVYVFDVRGGYKVYNDSNGSIANVTVNAFMLNKASHWNYLGLFYNHNTRMLYRYEGTTRRQYEFVPLGWFIAERPNVPNVIEINFTCYDQMQKFEQDMPGDADLKSAYETKWPGYTYSYPLTFRKLLDGMCAYAGVENRAGSFINSTAMLSKRPDDFDSVTMRDVMKWIAEAAGSNARFDRDGYLVLDWIRTNTGQAIDETGYAEFNPYWYETKPVTKLYNQASSGEYVKTYGNGDEGYLIQDNPLLKGVT